MSVFDYLSIYDINTENIIFEISLPERMRSKQTRSMQPQQIQQTPSQVAEEDGMVEFETLKKYLLYGKLKEIKYKLNKTKLRKSNVMIQSVYESIELILQFYNTFSYTDCKKLIDRVTDMIITANNLQLPSQRLNLEPELDQKKVQAQQAQQAQSQVEDDEKKKQQDVQDHMTNIQKRNAELDLILKRLDVGMRMNQVTNDLKNPPDPNMGQ